MVKYIGVGDVCFILIMVGVVVGIFLVWGMVQYGQDIFMVKVVFNMVLILWEQIYVYL